MPLDYSKRHRSRPARGSRPAHAQALFQHLMPKAVQGSHSTMGVGPASPAARGGFGSGFPGMGGGGGGGAAGGGIGASLAEALIPVPGAPSGMPSPGIAPEPPAAPSPLPTPGFAYPAPPPAVQQAGPSIVANAGQTAGQLGLPPMFPQPAPAPILSNLGQLAGQYPRLSGYGSRYY